MSLKRSAGQLLVVAAATIVSGCNQDVRSRPLATIDLSNLETVAAAGRKLPERERGALVTYALLHWPGSKSYCGSPIDQHQKAPSTVGEAIQVTFDFEKSLEATRQAALMKSPVELAAAQDQMLIDRLEALTLDRQRLALGAGDSSPERRRAAAIDREIEAVKRQRQELTDRRQAQHQR